MDMANPVAGGAEVHLTEIFKRFADRGDKVVLVSSGFKGGSDRDDYEGIEIYRTGSRETFNFTAPSLLRKLDREYDFDIVVEDINKVPLFTPLYMKKPVLVTIPHLFGTAVFRETNPVLASYVYLMERPLGLVYRNSVFEVISESTATDLQHRGIDQRNIRTVYCGMDHDTYFPDMNAVKFEQPTLLYVGRIKRYKSVDVIVRALPAVIERVPDARLVIVGSGDAVDEITDLGKSLGVSDRLVFTGFVSTEEKVDWMRRSHVIVNPSPKEGWGLTNIEANACGTVAVASDADGLRDSVRDGETGLLFPYGDHEALAGHLIDLLTDSDRMSLLTANALEWSRTFTWDAAAEKTMEIIDEIVGSAT